MILSYANLFFGLLSSGIAIALIVVMVQAGGAPGLNLGTALALGFAVNGLVRLRMGARQHSQHPKTGRPR